MSAWHALIHIIHVIGSAQNLSAIFSCKILSYTLGETLDEVLNFEVILFLSICELSDGTGSSSTLGCSKDKELVP